MRGARRGPVVDARGIVGRAARTLAALAVLSSAACGGGSGGGSGGGGGGGAPGSNAELATLVPSAGALVPGFDPGTVAYGVAIGDLPASVSFDMSTADPDAVVSVNGAPVEPAGKGGPVVIEASLTPVTIEVTAADGVTTRDYVVVFARSEFSFSQEAYVKASNTGAGDQFGGIDDALGQAGGAPPPRVAVSGDTLVVGVPSEDSDATGVNGDATNDLAPNSGAAYVFVRSGGTWVQQAYLKASNGRSSDGFGGSVAIDGETIVVGAPGEDGAAAGVDPEPGGHLAESGAAYVFVRDGATWTQQAYLKASNPQEEALFGGSVALSGDTALIGSLLEGSPTPITDYSLDTETGGAYVFVRTGGTWSEQALLKAFDGESGDRFGESVAIDGDTAVVGAPRESSDALGVDGDPLNSDAYRSGAAYVFVREGAIWTQDAYLKATHPTAEFGCAVALSGDTVAVGARGDFSGATGVDGDPFASSAFGSGAVFVYVRAGGTWEPQAFVKPSNTDAFDRFGSSVALEGDTLVVGAPYEDGAGTGLDGDASSDALGQSGAAYVFVRAGGTWSQRHYVKALVTDFGDCFGGSVAISGDALVVGAGGEDGASTGVGGDASSDAMPGSGAVYVFR
jgi:hypothetical protein